VSGSALFWEKSGSGPPVALLHGFTGSTRSWDAVREHLAETCTVIAIDLPGHGQSPSPPDLAEYGVRNAARLVAQAIERAGFARAAVMGYSMGARTALRLALDQPETCAGLVLESASPGLASDAERDKRRAEDESRAARIERDGVRAFVREWEQLPLWQSQVQLDPVTVTRQREIRLSQSPVGLASSLRGAGAGNEPSILEELPTLPMPVLLLAGALDAAYVTHATAMASRLRNATVHIEPQAGHALHLERPLKVASLVKRFVETLGL
jgi:2-succinyl-6-hydroxy-2,4-cyclohexadiene-1-carboxylate synthase